MPEHRAGLRLAAVAAGVDDHLAGHPGRGAGAVRGARPGAARGRCRWRCRPTSPPGRPARTGRRGPRTARGYRRGQVVLQVVVGGAAAAVQQPGLAERVGAGAHAGHRAAAGVVGGQRRARRRAQQRASPRGCARRQPGTTMQVAGLQRRPVRAGPQRQALRGGDLGLLRDVVQARRGAQLGRGGNTWAGPARSSRCTPGTSRKTTLVMSQRPPRRWPTRRPPGARSATVAMVANRPASAYSVRVDDVGGLQRARVGQDLGHAPPGREVPVRDRGGRGGVGDERDAVAEVGGEPGGRLAALLGADAADDQVPDAPRRSGSAAGWSW